MPKKTQKKSKPNTALILWVLHLIIPTLRWFAKWLARSVSGKGILISLSITQVAEAEKQQLGPSRAVPRVGGFTASCVLVSNAVGSGIFTTTGFLARDVGDPGWILALWVIGGALNLAIIY